MPILSTDAFTGTNGTALPTYAPSRWMTSPGDSNLVIQTNTAGSGSGANSGAVNIEVVWPQDHYTQATVVAITDWTQLVTVRHSAVDHKTFYGAGHVNNDFGDKKYRIVKYVDTDFTPLAGVASQVMTIGDVVRLEIMQLELVLYVNSIEVLRFTDGIEVLWTGNSGMYIAHPSSGLQIWDAYEAGTPDAGEPTNPSILSGNEKGWS